MLRVNLMPTPRVVLLQRRRASSMWVRWLGWYVGGLGLVALLLNTTGVGRGESANNLGEAQEKQEALRTEIDGLNAAITKQESTLRSAKEVGQHPDWSVLLTYLARQRETLAAVRLTSLELTTVLRELEAPDAPTAGASGSAPGGAPAKLRERVSKLRLVGTGRDAQDALAFSKVLDDAKVFTRVRTESIGDASAGSSEGDARIGFVISCELSEEPMRGPDLSEGGQP